MNELSTTLNYGLMAHEDVLNTNVSIKTLLKITKEHDYRLKSCFTLLKSRYDAILRTHNLDEIRECLIRLNDTQVLVASIFKELLRSEGGIQSQLAPNKNNMLQTSEPPIIVLPKQAQQVNDLGLRISALQKELNAFCME